MFMVRRYIPHFLAIALLSVAGLLKVWSYADENGNRVVFRPAPLPASIAGWKYVREIEPDKSVHRMLQEDAIQWRGYKRGEQWADLLVLYGHRKRTFHLPDSCLAGAGITILARKIIVLKSPDGSQVPFHVLMLQRDDSTSLALYTFIGPDGKPTDLLGLNMGMLFRRMRGQGPKGAAIRVIGPVDPEKPLASQSICNLATFALLEVGERVRRAAPMRQ